MQPLFPLSPLYLMGIGHGQAEVVICTWKKAQGGSKRSKEAFLPLRSPCTSEQFGNIQVRSDNIGHVILDLFQSLKLSLDIQSRVS